MKRTLSLLLPLFLSFSVHAQLWEIATYAGTGMPGYSGDGSVATAADFNGPLCMAMDQDRNLFVADFYNARIRKVKPNGIIVTMAGNGTLGYGGDGTIATSAEIYPHGVAADKHGNVFLSDPANNVIRKINAAGIISTYAGDGTAGYADATTALAAEFNAPFGLYVDGHDNLYIADAGNHAIRRIDSATGAVTTVAGSGVMGYYGDGGPAGLAQLDSPFAITFDKAGDLFIADRNNNVVREVNATNGLINTIAGTGAIGYSGDSALATDATMHYPVSVATDTAGNVYIADSYNNVIREVDMTTGNIVTVAGNGYAGFGGDLGYPTGANLFHPYSIVLDTFNSIYIADANNQRIRKVFNPLANGVADVNTKNEIRLFPNPAHTSITITGVQNGDKIGLIDVTGKMVTSLSQATGTAVEIPVSQLAEGLYLVQIWSANGSPKATIKITKD